MYKDNINEIRNKALLSYQLASIIESGQMDLEKGIPRIKDFIRDLVETLDKMYAIENNTEALNNDVAYDFEYESLFEPIEVNPETLSSIEDYLRTNKI